MTDVTPARKNIQVEETRFRYAVAESQQQKQGGSINFINDFQHSEKQFFINGPYGLAVTPFFGVDGLAVFEFNAAIIDIWMFVITAGSSGTTEIDLRIATTPGGSFTSIFTTTPKISFNAGNNIWVGAPGGSYTPPANTVAPVLTSQPLIVPAHTAIVCDLLNTQGGDPFSCGILVHYRPN